MKAAYFTDFSGSPEQEQKKWKQVQSVVEEGTQIVAVMSGEFLQSGLVAKRSVKDRAEFARDLGVDAVLVMSAYACLSSVGIYAFAAARLLDKLSDIQTLVLHTKEADLEKLTEIAFLLISNTRAFQQRVSDYKHAGYCFHLAQAKAIGEFVKDGERIMSCWDNIFAVECIKSLKLMYSGIQCVCVPLETEGLFGNGGAFLEKEYEKLDHLLRYHFFYSKQNLSDVYGGYDELTNQILREQDHYDGFVSFSAKIAGQQKDLFDVRKYFLRLVCGIEKSTIGIWRMYDFSPYCRICCEDEKLLAELMAKSKVQILVSSESPAGMERSKKELLEQEERIAQIYGLLQE